MVNIKKYIIFTLSIFYYVLPYNESLDVITTNDMHGFIHAQEAHFINPNHPPMIIGGSGFIHYVNNLRQELDNDKILLLDGGNFFQGHPIGIVDSGRTMIKWMNKVGYHAMVPGNYDFLFGLDNLINLSKKANFSFLAANLFYKSNNALIFKPYEIIEFKDVTVGVIGIVNPDLENLVLPQNIKDVQLKNPINILENIISDIEDEIDILILLTSAGVPWDRDKVYDDFILEKKKIDDFNNTGFIGIGFNQNDNGTIDISSVYPGMSGDKAGLKKGDIINKINNEEPPFSNRLDGDINSNIELEVYRPGDETESFEILTFNIKRLELTKDYLDKYISGRNISERIYNKKFNAIELGYYASGIDIIVSGGVSKGYPEPWYDSNSHVYTFQNYGGGTSFGHFIIKYDEKTKLFSGYESAVTSQSSQTLFINDFRFDNNMYDWISDVSIKANNKVYQPTDWTSSINSDGENASKKYSGVMNNWDIPSIDIKENIDILTWNCEFFPTAKDSTIEALSEAVFDLSPDIIAFQEIKNRGWFGKLMELLPDYNYVISQQSSFMDQAVIYKKKDFILVNRLEIFAENDYNFAGRPPLKVDFIYKKNNMNFSIINLHMKCCDSGLQRRIKAANMLYTYLDKELSSNDNIIVLGDWNDDLKDKQGEHCFDSFLNDDRFYFPTIDLTYDVTKASYPKKPYVSFLDHILVTSSFIDKKSYRVDTIPMDEYMGGFDIYESYISDHMPVYLSFPIK